jgi:hypothetical protein
VTTTLWEFALGPVQLALINPAKVGRYLNIIYFMYYVFLYSFFKTVLVLFLYVFFRPLYDSSGAFSIDQLIPLPDALLKPACAPAYSVKCSAFNLDRKDGLLGESGTRGKIYQNDMGSFLGAGYQTWYITFLFYAKCFFVECSI